MSAGWADICGNDYHTHISPICFGMLSAMRPIKMVRCSLLVPKRDFLGQLDPRQSRVIGIMRQKDTKQMLKYWLELFWEAGNQSGKLQSPQWPERSDIQPARCRSLLSNMFVLERHNGTINYRLAGTSLCNLFGRELKREKFTQTLVREDQSSASSWSDRLGLDDHLVLLCTTGEAESGERVNLETLMMPLNHNGLRGNRILGITTALDEPYWLGVRPILKQSIRSVRILRPWENQTARFGEQSAEAPPISFQPRLARVDSPTLSDSGAYGMEGKSDNEDAVSGHRIAHLTVIEGGRN